MDYNFKNAGVIPSVSYITDYIDNNPELSNLDYNGLCIGKPNTNNISMIYLVYSQGEGFYYYRKRIAVYWENGYITNLSPATGSGGNTQTSIGADCYTLQSFFDVYGASPKGGEEYTEFWFPLVSIIVFIFICSMIYKIIIKRLLP